MSEQIRAMPPVVWPTEPGRRLARRAGELADVLARQKYERGNLTANAREEWKGKAREQFDSQHEGPTTSVAQNLIENLYAMERVLRDVESWAERENEARRKAREREHDDTTWGGMKKYWNSLTEDW